MKNKIIDFFIKNNLIPLSILFLLAFFERTLFDLGPNIELVTMAMILSGLYFGKKQSLLITFLIMAGSDAVLGNSNIFIFTWSGFLIPAFITGSYFNKIRKGWKFNTKFKAGLFSGMGSTLFFFFWTNFGVWLLGSMYPKNLSGLIASFVMGLPFLKAQELSTLIFVPAGIIIFESLQIAYHNRFSKATFLPNRSRS